MYRDGLETARYSEYAPCNKSGDINQENAAITVEQFSLERLFACRCCRNATLSDPESRQAVTMGDFLRPAYTVRRAVPCSLANHLNHLQAGACKLKAPAS